MDGYTTCAKCNDGLRYIGTGEYVLCGCVDALLAELTALRAKVAAGERLRNGVAGAADDYGFDSEMVEFADDIRGRVAEYDAAVKP